jgi:uncharacterized membrane protein YjfL (UPF0719 family)
MAAQQGRGTVNGLLLSLAQLALAIVLSALAAYLAFYLLQVLARRLNGWQGLQQGNIAVGIVLGAAIVAVAIVLRPALSLNITGWDAGGALPWKALLTQALQLAIGLVLAVVTLALALLIFGALTRDLDEIEELRKANLAVAALLAGVLVGVGIMVGQAMAQLMTALSRLIH